MPPLHSLDSRVRELPPLYPEIQIPDTIEELCPLPSEPKPTATPPLVPHWLERFAGIRLKQSELTAIKYGLPCAVALVAVYEVTLAAVWVASVLLSHIALLGLIAALLFGALRVVVSHRSTPRASLTREPLWAARPVVTPITQPQPAAVIVTEPRERGGIGRLFLGDDRPQSVDTSTSPFTGKVRPERSGFGRFFLGDERETVAPANPAQVWAAELRENGHLQAKGIYADGSGNYCAVGMVTHRSGRMTHREMGREFGTGFVRDVEEYNDSTRATFSDVADYIEKKKG